MIELKGGEIRITVLSEKINDGMRIDNTVIILSFGEAECRIEVGVQAEKAK